MADIDIGPELYEQIRKDFNAGVNADASISKLATKISKGKGTQRDMTTLADRFGVQASKALKNNLKLANMPNETMYWNVAEKTIQPMLERAWTIINDYAGMCQQFADHKSKLNIAILRGQDPTERIKQVMNFAVNSITQPELDNALTDPAVSTVRKFYDDFIKTNCDLRNEMGFTEVIVREYDGVGLHDGKTACQWCLDRAGTWSYEDAKANGVFERHPGCGCTIAHFTERGMNLQTNWTSNEWQMTS